MRRLKLILVFFIGIILGILLYELGNSYFVNRNEGDGSQKIELGIKGTLKETVKDVVNSISDIYTDDEYVSSEKYRIFEEVDNILKEEYFAPENLSGSEMLENAIKGYVDAVGDPFTVYLSPVDNKTFNEELEGSNEFEGIGAYVTKKENGVMLERLIKGGPAFNSELKPLDIVIKADDVSLVDLPLGEAISYIKGPAGSSVTLTVLRDNTVFEVDIVRDKIEIHSVEGEVLQLTGGVNIGYITISIFGEDTSDSLNRVIRDLRKEDIDGVLVDLRGNGGGILPVAVDVASHWVPKEKLISIARYRIKNDDELTSFGHGEFEDVPTVILIDGLTASASEIISAAIKYRNNTMLVGTNTFGKGSIQTIDEFSDGSSLKYTIGKWDTPSGKNIDKEGIAPDIEVEFDAEKYQDGFDNQLESGKEVILDMINSN